MKKSRYSEEQIARVLAEAAAGAKSIREVCREHGVTEHTFYIWRRKYGGIETDDIKRLRELEAENAALKRIVANQAGHRRSEDGDAKKWHGAPCRRTGSALRGRGVRLECCWPCDFNPGRSERSVPLPGRVRLGLLFESTTVRREIGTARTSRSAHHHRSRSLQHRRRYRGFDGESKHVHPGCDREQCVRSLLGVVSGCRIRLPGSRACCGCARLPFADRSNPHMKYGTDVL
ncbi:transposase [Fimbriimonadia bacterium ATM]|nr:MAG: transposase [Armatimonadota bacterium]MBC6970503.1 transposase [Armatimonadota bacterium]MCE7900814.1 transposase [Armatimonadetes bacterium ATM1]MDL1929856.1 transposase [Fimbriimonadia bacterium ATM]RIJ95548.1 MAG: hypothetical protein DCC45_10090 [Armatimonadota bacterium]